MNKIFRLFLGGLIATTVLFMWHLREGHLGVPDALAQTTPEPIVDIELMGNSVALAWSNDGSQVMFEVMFDYSYAGYESRMLNVETGEFEETTSESGMMWDVCNPRVDSTFVYSRGLSGLWATTDGSDAVLLDETPNWLYLGTYPVGPCLSPTGRHVLYLTKTGQGVTVRVYEIPVI